jgi:hypothetical protein
MRTNPHDYLPDAVGMLSNGTFFIAESGMEDDKRQDRNLAKAEAARRLARIRRPRSSTPDIRPGALTVAGQRAW